MSEFIFNYWSAIPILSTIILGVRLFTKDSNQRSIEISVMQNEISNLEKRIDGIELTSKTELNKIENKLDRIMDLLLKMIKN